MRVIPVLDIRCGHAVHAVAGRRDHYGPLRSVLHDSTDPITLARAGVETWSLPDLYLADLDAILGQATPNLDLFRTIQDLGLVTWVDAGIRDLHHVPAMIEAGVGRIIVGLETIAGPQALKDVLASIGADRVVFSLDLRDGQPLVETSTTWGTSIVPEIAEHAIDLGVRRIIHLDLAQVGVGWKSDTQPFAWLADLARSNPGVEWLVGGGIDSVEALEALDRMGAWGALVGSALHDGRMTAEQLKRFSPM